MLEGIGAAVGLMQEGFSLELIGVRRILEPAATALAAERIDDDTLAKLGACLQRMRDAASEAEGIQHDEDFHRLVGAASGNETLASMLNAVSSRTMRARAWRGIAEEGAGARTVAQHQDILDALAARDPGRSESAALVYVATTEAWFWLALIALVLITLVRTEPTIQGYRLHLNFAPSWAQLVKSYYLMGNWNLLWYAVIALLIFGWRCLTKPRSGCST